MYKHVVGKPLGDVVDAVRAKRPQRLPVVLSREEVGRLLRHLDGPYWLAASLLYGSGLRLMECLRLRVKDLLDGFGAVWLPHVPARKYPQADRSWGWQYAFPAARRSVDPGSGVTRRRHLDDSCLQKAVKMAVRKAGIEEPTSCHTLRHNPLPLTCWNAAWIYARCRNS